MTIQAARLTILAAAGLTGLAGVLAGCSTSAGLGDATPSAKPPAAAVASPDITGSIAAPAAAPAPAPAAEPSSLRATPLQSAILPFLFLGAGR
ncbi:MAG TPA: hypothetical protein VL048_01185 [Xanthobacteraceae bacterium]|nr:hypothetical protein [Xanthobacteraceae bacterium]